MTEETIRKGYELAEKDAQEKQVQEVKEIVAKSLEKLEEVKKKIDALRAEEKILKMDLEDLKVGKIDRIVERQEKDPKAKEVSVVVIIKEREVIRETNPWYWPYRVIWNEPYRPVWYTNSDVYCGGNSSFSSNADQFQTLDQPVGMINCSVAKEAAIGTYEVNGHPVHLR